MALRYPAWGHRKIWALLVADGHEASQATVRRALRARALLQPAGATRERRQLARARRNAFVDPPARRNRVWQTDFSELETLGAGVWQLGGLVDYVCKVCLACPVTATKTWRDAVGVLEDARGRAQELIGRSLLEDCTDPGDRRDRAGHRGHRQRLLLPRGGALRVTSRSAPSSATCARATRHRRPTA